MIKRVVSYMLVMLMIFSSVPAGVFAVESETEKRSDEVEIVLSDSFRVSLSEEPSFSFFTRGSYSDCYGNQLDGLAKEFYDALTEYYAEGKNTDFCNYQLKEKIVFEMTDEGVTYVSEEIGMASQIAMDAFLYDHPEVFWLKVFSTSYGYVYYWSDEAGALIAEIENITFKCYELYNGASSQVAEFDSAVDAAVEEIVAAVSEDANRYDMLKEVHDYICNVAYYDYDGEIENHSAMPIFIDDGGVVCEGYAKAFKILCDELDIPCALIIGDAGGAHMWNYVQMDDGKWYLVDVTWDDQESKIYDTYFIANANTIGFDGVTISQERASDGDFSSTGYMNFVYPKLSTADYVSHTHEWNESFTVDSAATCTESGSKSIHCKSCDEKKEATEISSLGHDFKNYVSDNNASCTADGTKTAKCERCDETDTVTDEGSKLAHEWNEWVSISSPSCTVGGVEKRSCKNCTASETRNVGATNHANAYITDKVNATCTEVGYTSGLYCPDCKIWISGHDEVASLGHDFKNYVSDNNASCATDGTKTAKCERCDETDTVTDEGSKLAHEWGEWASISSPSCTVGGVEKRSCKNCTASETRNVGATNHANAYITTAVSPTCIEVGYTSGLYCPDCKIWISGHDEVASLGHDFKNYVSDNNASCTADGTKTAKCERCDETDTVTDEGSKLAHEWGEWTVTSYPSCTLKGIEIRYCAGCGKSEIGYVDATNHPDAYETEGVAASCSAVGYTEGVYCPDCKKWISGHKEIVKAPHKFTEKIIDEAHLISAATVIDFAVYGYDCESCDEISKTATFTHGERVPLGKTSKITAIQDTSTIRLTWADVDYAVGYKVYRKVGDGWKNLGTVTSATARIRNLSVGTKYTFAIMAATRIDGKVVWSKEYTTISTATQAPLPTTIKTNQNASTIQLIWNSCVGATGYRVYLVEGADMTYLGQVKGTKATLRNLKAGTKYTYAIRPFITLDDGSVVWSAYKTYTASTTPAAPVTTVASSSSRKITVKWKAVNGAEAYQLYYKTGNGSYKLYKNYSGAKTLTFSNLKSGTKYTFVVRAAIKTSGGWIYGSYKPVSVTVK